ncbi:MAG: acyl-CoA dehydrogenase [Deltaproteobacteria bacterium HGW-Deltaproteobacteria-14]|jgi:alkylation response protein AidB-like acyl-CoA dehydrogenase|nr:MAG: acyl-CoA dehydrogenase [Deltaproteobacteria bacterium HGW-Deltaproteobacteria-14]
MKLALTEDQRLIKDSAVTLWKDKGAVRRLRSLRDTGDATGFSRELWAELAGLGWLGLPFPEEHGGVGLGVTELCLVLEEAGRTLAPEPLLATTLLAGSALLLGDSDAARSAWLPGLIAGDVVGTLAWQERARRDDDPPSCAALATPAGDGAVMLHGSKREVVAGVQADLVIVAAQHSETRELGLWAVPGDAAGLLRTPLSRIDHFPCARVELDGVRLSEDARLGGAALLASALDRATIGLAAEALGAMSAAFELTLGWLRERRQFGVPIGSFQALQHRAARLYIDLELCRSAVMAAARTADQPRVSAAVLGQAASLAAARTLDTFLRVADEAVQLHGGVGMTDEHDIGFYLKRARVVASTFGDAAWHRDRWARLAGY